ncbi:MAG: ACT domain-containing protein [Pseudomonadota bacterium]
MAAAGAVRETAAMIAGMRPALQPGTWSFVTLGPDDPRLSQALATMREPEGLSVILPAGDDDPLPMAHILLQVTSALDGVGLTAAVSTALAAADIPCNVVAGHHHDHIFVPQSQANAALRILERRAAE